MKIWKYIFGISLLVTLVGCSNKSEEDELEKQREKELVEYVKSLDEDSETTSERVYGSQEEVEELLGITLNDYHDDDSEIGSIKTEVYNLVIKDGLSQFPALSIEQIKSYFVDNADATVSGIISQFGKPTEITVYRSSRYSHDAQVLLEWRLADLNDTEHVKRLEVRWNIWDNSDIKTRQVEIEKYSHGEGYDLRTKIMIDGIIQ
ncbi:TPA: hypothetical protein U1W61_001553 [Streptococcus suis]|nr:hypothetical protein [Streptococcus suis]